MTIRTVTISDITAVDFDPDKENPYFYLSEKYVWVRNKSPAEIYVSANAEPVPESFGTGKVPAGGCVRFEIPETNILYFLGNGKAEVRTGNVPTVPVVFTGPSGGGQAALGTKDITENGVYNASSDGFDGYSEVSVNVETPFTLGYTDGNTGLVFLSQYSEFTGHMYNYPLNITAGEDITIELCARADPGREHYGRYFDSGDIIIADCPENGVYYLEFSVNNQWQIAYDKGDRIELPQGTEYTLTFRITSGGMDIFIDGEFYLFTSKINNSMYHSASRTDFWLMDSTASNRVVNGKIYAFRIYGRALTNAEIAHDHTVDLKIIDLQKGQ